MIELKCRIKNSFGEVIAFDVSIDGNPIERLNIDVLISWKDRISNAICINNKDFKAKPGYHIDTRVEYSSLLEQRKYNKLTYKGFNLDYYGKGFESICRKIRKYASIGRIIVKKEVHDSNRHSRNLIQAIEYCGINSSMFLTVLLQNLQPYSLSKFQDKKAKWHGNDDIWLYDLGYNIKIVLKFQVINNLDMLVVSFHESIMSGKYQGSVTSFKDKLCAIFIDNCILQGDVYTVAYTVQLGFIRIDNIYSRTKYVNDDLALIPFTDFNFRFTDMLNREYQRICDMYNSALGFTVIPIDTKFSFMSYGFNLLNNISMLIDIYALNKDASLGLDIINVTSALLKEVSPEKLVELKNVLIEKYGIGYTNKLYEAIVG